MWTEETFSALLQWFHQEGEVHFFRQDRTPYRVWVSEVALQQTRVQAALEPLRHFLDTFPNVESLAAAEEEAVVQAFRGLGYYHRARNLHRGAKTIVQQYGGHFPQTYEELLQIPSIGPYTAAAIGSICFGLPIPVVDGNVKRVLARTECWSLPRDSSELEKQSRQLLTPLFQSTSLPPGDLNEALMELGQKYCTPRKPHCFSCPIQKWCGGFQQGTPELYPGPSSKRKKQTDLLWQAFILQWEGKIGLQYWEDFYFLKGHWAFPSILQFPEKGKKLLSHSGLTQIESWRELSEQRHTITHHRIRLIPCVVSLEKPWLSSLVWLTPEEVEQKLAASAMLKVWRAYCKTTLGQLSLWDFSRSPSTL